MIETPPFSTMLCFKGTEATCVKIATEMKKCYRLKEMSNLKLVSAIFYEIFIFSPNDRSLKTLKHVFYFI